MPLRSRARRSSAVVWVCVCVCDAPSTQQPGSERVGNGTYPEHAGRGTLCDDESHDTGHITGEHGHTPHRTAHSHSHGMHLQSQT